MTEPQNSLTAVYEQTQHALFVQILRAVRIGLILGIERYMLDRVVASRANLLPVDVTGVPVFDTFVAKGLLRMGQALRLLGTQMALTGLKPATAQTLAQIGADLGGIKTYGAIQDALLEYQR